MKDPRFERLLFALLAAAILLVAGNAWLAFHAEQVLAESEFWVAHTWEVIAQIDTILGEVKDVETGARGYLITGDPDYLTFHDTGARALPGSLALLRSLVSDNPVQIAKSATLAQVANHRVALIESTVGIRRTHGQAAAFAVVSDGLGIAEMNRLRMLAAGMQSDEHTLLTLRLQASARARNQARGTVVFASALDIAFILLTLWSLGYERRLRHRISETARRLEKLQSISDVGLTKLNVSELTQEMLDRLRRVAEIDAVALFSWHETEIEVLAVDGISLIPGTRVQLRPNGPLRQCGEENRPVKLHGANVKQIGVQAFHNEWRSLLILPLATNKRVIALVVAARTGEDAFSIQDEQLLSVVADRIAVSIDRATLFDAEHEARRLAEESAAEVRSLNAELEERVRLRTAELEATNRELEAFSYSVSHDLRAPLRSVDGFSVALEEDYGEALTGEGKHYLGRIRAGVQRMGQLIDALLQLSRITRSELVPEPVSLSELAGEVARELVDQNPDRSLDFAIEPELSTIGDPRLLRAVFENMLGNAVKFTANVAEPQIAFGYSAERDAYFIRDNGAGFDQQYASKLFVAFQRLHGEKDFKGSGIGLATVARVLRRHHGTMSAEGAIGKGATFWFTLGTDSSWLPD